MFFLNVSFSLYALEYNSTCHIFSVLRNLCFFSVCHVFKRGTSTYSHFTHEFLNSGWLSVKVYISLWRDDPAFKLVHDGKHSWMYNMSVDTLKCWRHHWEKMKMNEWMGERIFWMMILYHKYNVVMFFDMRRCECMFFIFISSRAE